MLFKVRDGYHAILQELTRDPTSGKVIAIDETRVNGGTESDFTAQQALDHLAKLEPVDQAATDFMTAQFASHGLAPDGTRL